ncbi:MAG: prepilin-type N-terminal cleavage/methylation domain-containing protein [Nitrospinae bacterium]|nr:prepilin-type N-terminal cleavage/methylation domain-containing protein [Nitrospinota bacterium]
MYLIGFFKNPKGFTLVELMIVVALIAILGGLAYSNFKRTKEKIACGDVYSAFQSAKMRAISTGSSAYVDFDMNGGAVSDNFFTVYLDTDGDAAFGETSNANGDNEFTVSNFAMPDASGGAPGVALPEGVKFGGKATSPGGGTMGVYGPTWGVIPDDGVTFGASGNRASFNSQGTAAAGSVYLYDSTDSRGAGCAVIVSSTGIIRKYNWNGSSWN